MALLSSAVCRAPLAWTLVGVTLVTACAQIPKNVSSGSPGGATLAAPDSSVPAWVGMEQSWEKLGAIETWLGGDSYSPPFWQAEGRLQLSEGRLEFAQQDRQAGRARDAELRARLSAARVGFELVLSDPSATEWQKTRARDGLSGSGGTPLQPRAVNAVTSALVSRDGWGACRAVPARMKRNGRAYERITVHHSAMADPPAMSGEVRQSAQAVRDIQLAHMNGKGYGDIGYHFLIDPYGHVFVGRELDWQGAHAGGTNNVRNIGICLIGNFEEQRPTQKSTVALERLVDDLREQYDIPARNVVPHSQWRSTVCPGRHLRTWIRAYG